jgi:hypothetical protein
MSFRTKRRFVAFAVLLFGVIFTVGSLQDFVNFVMGGLVGLAIIWFSEPIGKNLNIPGTSGGVGSELAELAGWGIILINFLLVFVI